MGIDLGGGWGGVAEEFLYGTEVSTMGKDVGRKGVTKLMGRKITREACNGEPIFHEAFDRTGGEAFAIIVEEDGAGTLGGVGPQLAGGSLHRLNCFARGCAEDAEALFISFTANNAGALVKAEVRIVEGDKFCDTHAGGVERFKDSAIA